MKYFIAYLVIVLFGVLGCVALGRCVTGPSELGWALVAQLLFIFSGFIAGYWWHK